MKGVSHPTNDVSLNPSVNESIHEVIERVDVVAALVSSKTGIGAAALTSAGGLTLGGLGALGGSESRPTAHPGIGFAGVPASRAPVADVVHVPAGYNAEVLVAWGDPIMPGGTAFRGDATETAADQMKQFGEHCDGMHFFPLYDNNGDLASDIGILCVNNEYTHEEILFPDGQVGVGLHDREDAQVAGRPRCVDRRGPPRGCAGAAGRCKWTVNRDSMYGRRITGNTPVRISGPAAGHPLMQTKEFESPIRARSPPAALDRRLSRPRHAEQLRAWLHALGHVPHLRGELERLLRRHGRGGHQHDDRDRQAESPLRHHCRRLRLSLAHDRPALRRQRQSERAAPLRLGRRDRPVQSAGASRSSARRWAASSTRARSTSSTRTTASRSTWATTSATSTSTSSSARIATQEKQPAPQPRPARPRHAVRREVRCRPHRRVDRAAARHDRRRRQGAARQPELRAARTTPTCWRRS